MTAADRKRHFLSIPVARARAYVFDRLGPEWTSWPANQHALAMGPDRLGWTALSQVTGARIEAQEEGLVERRYTEIGCQARLTPAGIAYKERLGLGRAA